MAPNNAGSISTNSCARYPRHAMGGVGGRAADPRATGPLGSRPVRQTMPSPGTWKRGFWGPGAGVPTCVGAGRPGNVTVRSLFTK